MKDAGSMEREEGWERDRIRKYDRGSKRENERARETAKKTEKENYRGRGRRER